MPNAQENAALVRRGYELFNSGNMEELAKLFREDAVWHGAGRGRFAGEKRGRDACLAYFGQVVEAAGGQFRAEVHDVAASEEHGVGIHTTVAERAGKRLSLKTVLLFHVRDGQIAEAWEHYEDTAAWDQFFA
jgi:ketosteroid isomerase-like protein